MDDTQVLESFHLRTSEELLPLVYNELRRLASQKLSHEKPGQTLQATALVHELIGEGSFGNVYNLLLARQIGHMLGLRHDGDSSATGFRHEYRGPHGEGETTWSPIMGQLDQAAGDGLR